MNARLRETEGWAELTTPARAALVFYIAAEYAFLAAMPLAFVAALTSWRLGAYLLIVAFTIHILGRQVALLVFAAHQDEVRVPREEQRAALVGIGFMAILAAGLYAALGGWRPGAYVAVAGLLGLLASHLAAGGLAYRRVMTRPWPNVSPAVEDDDDW